MQRPGNAGSLTASDHLAALTAAVDQIPAQVARDLLVSIDGAGAPDATLGGQRFARR